MESDDACGPDRTSLSSANYREWRVVRVTYSPIGRRCRRLGRPPLATPQRIRPQNKTFIRFVHPAVANCHLHGQINV